MLKVIALVLVATAGYAIQPEMAELTFDTRWNQPATATNALPAWVVGVEQRDGTFMDQPASWQASVGAGRLAIVLDRRAMPEDLAMSLLYAEDTNTDVAVQLLDAQDRVVVLDVFGNLMALGREAKTDTFIVPLRKYPTATKVAIRRIAGTVRVFGAALYPVVTEGEASLETLDQLAKSLGDPLSPENPLVRGINRIAGSDRLGQKSLPSPVSGPAGRTNAAPRAVASGGWLDWYVQPFPVDSDWPGPRGMPATWENGELILTGQPVRSRRSFAAPVIVTGEVVLEARRANDGSLSINFEPEGVPLDHQGEQATGFAMIYRNPGAYSGKDGLIVQQRTALTERLRPVGKTLWGEEPFTVKANQLYKIVVAVRADGLRVTINDQSFDMPGVTVPYSRFHISLQSWQPTNRWHVRNLIVH